MVSKKNILCISVNLYLLLIGLFLCATIHAQQSIGGVPLSIETENMSSITRQGWSGSTVTMPLLSNITELQRADSIVDTLCSECENSYYGRGLDVSIDIKDEGQLFLLEDSSKLWIINIKAEDAYALQFYFDLFKLPFGAHMYIYNENRTMFQGGYTSDNNPTSDTVTIKFGTMPIKGESIFIEYYEPKDPDFSGELRISKVGHIFKDIFTQDEGGPYGTSSPCHINISCLIGAGWEKESSSVALILGYDQANDLFAVCSGALLNNTSEDGRPLFLSARHCIGGPSGTQSSIFNSDNWLFLFNHQTTNCSSDGSDVSAYLGQSIYGSLRLASDPQYSGVLSDYLLLELNASKETIKSLNLCYSGWDHTTSTPSGTVVGIHHPAGDVKKISRASSVLSSSSFIAQDRGQQYHDDLFSTHWVMDWNSGEGTTEGGSSGSPLFNSAHRVIGQVHSGYYPSVNDPCASDKLTSYGKLSSSWQRGDLSFWLDPLSTGQTYIDTYCPSTDSPGSGPSGGPGASGTSGCTNYIVGEEQEWPGSNGQKAGMFINGQGPLGVPCISSPELVLTPPRYTSNCNNNWFVPTNVHNSKCSEVVGDDDLCHRKITSPFRCNCLYYKYFIEIFEVNSSLNQQIGTAYQRWFSFQTEYQDYKWYVTTPSITITQSILSSMGVNFSSGKYYRIKIASLSGVSGNWYETSRYFRYMPDNLIYSPSTLPFGISNLNTTVSSSSQPITGQHISFSDFQVTAQNSFAATNSISMNTVSTFTAGEYRIDPYDCEDGVLRLGQSMRNDQFFSNVENTSLYPSSAESFMPVKPNNTIGNKIQDNVFDYKIIPNPNSGQFILYLENQKSQHDLFIVEMYDYIGKLVYSTSTLSPQIQINTNQLPGIYFIKVIDKDGLSKVKKMTYQ